MAGNDCCSDDFVSSLSGVDFYEAFFLTIQNSAVHFLEMAHVGIQFHPPLAGITFVEADMSDFRVSISAPGHGQGAGFLAAKEEGILNDEPGGKIGGMREFPVQANIAGSVNALVCGLQTIVYHHAFALVVLNTHTLQTQALDVRRATGSNQNFIDR